MKWISSGVLACVLVSAFAIRNSHSQGPASPFAPPPIPMQTRGNEFSPPPMAETPSVGGNASAPELNTAAFSPAQIVAIVGNQHILAGEIEGAVNQMLAINLAGLPPEQRELYASQLDRQKQALMRQQIQAEVQSKLLYLDFLRMGIPKEKLADVHRRVGSGFEQDIEAMRSKITGKKPEDYTDTVRKDPLIGRLAVLMELKKIETLGELDQELRQHGSSLEKQQRAYLENRIGQMMIGKNIKQNVEVSHEQMLEYYREHAETYAIPARARWEQLTVRFDRFPNREAAMQAIAAMGNEVYLGGAAFAAVAKRSSQEPNAEQGGVHDWTTKGSLVSKPLDNAIFTLPAGRLSQIIEDERGLHIIRVLERNEAGATPFVEAQVEIKEKIKTQRRMQDIKQYLDKIQKNATVWTIYDEASAANTAEKSEAERSPF